MKGSEMESMSEADGWRERKRLKRESYALGHYVGMLIWLVNDSDLAVWDWCLAGLMTAERLLDTHTHKRKLNESMKTYMQYKPRQTHTHTMHARMNAWSHFNTEVWKHVWIHIFSITYTDSFTGIRDLCLLSASRAEWVNMSWLIICF